MADHSSAQVGWLVEADWEHFGGELAENVVDNKSRLAIGGGHGLVAAKANWRRIVGVTLRYALVEMLELVEGAKALLLDAAVSLGDETIVIEEASLGGEGGKVGGEVGVVVLNKQPIDANCGGKGPHFIWAGAIDAFAWWALFSAIARRAGLTGGARLALRSRLPLRTLLTAGAGLALGTRLALRARGARRPGVAAAATASEEGEKDEEFSHVSPFARC